MHVSAINTILMEILSTQEYVIATHHCHMYNVKYSYIATILIIIWMLWIVWW